jgi:hypothetical protein
MVLPYVHNFMASNSDMCFTNVLARADRTFNMPNYSAKTCPGVSGNILSARIAQSKGLLSAMVKCLIKVNVR